MAFNPGGNDPRSMLVTSVIGGGGPQVIVGNFMDSNVAVLYDLSGMGNWGLNAQPFTCDGFPSAITTGDIDNDTLPDIVASTAAGTLDVFFNTAGSPGKFSLANKLTAGMNATGVAAGDFNGDGLVDVAGALDEGSIAVVISIKNRTFKPAVLYPVGKRPRSIAAGDVNADMIIDLAVANSSRTT